MNRRPGYAYVELLVTLAVTAILGTALSSVLLTHLQLARTVNARIAAAEALRLGFQVLPAELRFAAPAVDIHGMGSDSIAARLPRITGSICAQISGRLWIRGNGLREPDPQKDSVLVVTVGQELVAAVTAASSDPGPCQTIPGLSIYRVDTNPQLRAWGAAVVFESGTYYVRERAMRFRIGAEGRQPLTEEVLQKSGNWLMLRADSDGASLGIRLVSSGPWGRPLLAPAVARFFFLNAFREVKAP